MSRLSRAIILAAGLGSRLGPQTQNIPKTLLPIGDLTIFDRIIMGLDRIGVHDITVVTGHAGTILRSHAVSSSELLGNRVSLDFIVNDNLNIGNIYSFWLARDKMYEDFILLNSDVVFHYDILTLLRNDSHDSALMIDDLKILGSEEMKVTINDMGVVKEITKELDPLASDGEYIGVMKLSREIAEKAIDKVECLLARKRYPLYYEDALRRVAREEDSLFACTTKGLPWIEIDTIDDIHYARNRVLPQILRGIQ